MALDNEKQALAFLFPEELFLYFPSPQTLGFFLCVYPSVYSIAPYNAEFQCLTVLFLTDWACKGVADLCRGSEGAFCLRSLFSIVLQLKSPVLIVPCQEFVTSGPSYSPSRSIFSLWHSSVNT